MSQNKDLREEERFYTKLTIACILGGIMCALGSLWIEDIVMKVLLGGFAGWLFCLADNNSEKRLLKITDTYTKTIEITKHHFEKLVESIELLIKLNEAQKKEIGALKKKCKK